LARERLYQSLEIRAQTCIFGLEPFQFHGEFALFAALLRQSLKQSAAGLVALAQLCFHCLKPRRCFGHCSPRLGAHLGDGSLGLPQMGEAFFGQSRTERVDIDFGG
jgi:hypothetical protein